MPKQQLTVELLQDGVWQDITADDDVFAQPVRIKRGQSDEATQLRPASVSLQLANDDDKYRTSNPESPLYGKAGRNTPLRVSVGGVFRGVVEATSWEADQSRDFRRTPRRGKAWVDVEGGGLLQRVAQWTEPLRSPFYTYNSNLSTLVGYWPMEDARGTVAPAFTPVSGAVNRNLLGVSFDSQQRPPGSGPLADVVLQDASTFEFTDGAADSTGGWQYSVVVNMASLGNTFFTPVNLTMLDGSSVSLSLDDAANTTTLLAADASLATRFSSTNAFPAGFEWSGRWIIFVIKATYSGGTTTINAFYRALEESVWYNPSGTYSGVTSSLWQSYGSGLPDSSSFGHVIGTLGTGESLTAEDRVTAMRGHAGETAADRFERLCLQKSLNCTIIGTAADSRPMGPQAVDTFSNQLKEIAATEDGLLFDDIADIALVFMLRGARYNQTPALDLAPTDLPVLPREVTDDLGVHNVVTASQRDGGTYTAEDSTGPLGSQPPPDGAGEYRQTIDVNLNNEDELPELANWWLRRGTVNLPRFPQVTVNLAALDVPKIAEVESVDVGSVITITGMREYVIRLIVIGYTETIGTNARSIVFTCVPDQQFVVGVYDDTVRRYDLRTCTLNGAHHKSATSLTLAITADERWSTTSTPYNFLLGGEEVTVTSMGSRTGTGPYAQTATVIRSVNGIVKDQTADTEVHIATPGRWAS